MNVEGDYLPRLDSVPGESMLHRKRFHNLQMEANVFQQATNLQPPLDPPQPPMGPAQPPAEQEIIKWFMTYPKRIARRRQKIPKIRPYEAQKIIPKDCEPETQVA